MVRMGANPTYHIYRGRRGQEMEFYSSVYQLLYELEQNGKIRPLRGSDLIPEIDILAYIEERLRMVA